MGKTLFDAPTLRITIHTPVKENGFLLQQRAQNRAADPAPLGRSLRVSDTAQTLATLA